MRFRMRLRIRQVLMWAMPVKARQEYPVALIIYINGIRGQPNPGFSSAGMIPGNNMVCRHVFRIISGPLAAAFLNY